MTRDDIIKMAHEAECLNESHYGSLWVDRLVAFAALVAAAEREACAQVAEWEPCMTHTPQRIAAAIRARSTK